MRDRLWSLIRQTAKLDWIVLTKRIGNAPEMLPKDWGGGYPNVWLLISVDQAGLERDLPKLLAISAVVHGLSIEPQLTPVHLGDFAPRLQGVINGGESGGGARPYHLEWARSLVAECRASGTAIFIQKLGCKPFEGGRPLRLNDYAGGDMNEWPADLRFRQFPVARDAARGAPLS
jgi:protein gp37